MAGNWWRLYPPKRMKRALDAALRFDDEGGAASLIHQASVTLDDDQIKALPTGVEITGVPGVTRLIVCVSGFLRIDATAGAYSGRTDASIFLMVGLGEGVSYASTLVLTELSLGGSQITYGPIPCPYFEPSTQSPFTGFIATSPYYDTGLNGALAIKDDWAGLSDYGDGHPLNTMDVSVGFMVWDTALKRFLTTTESGWDQDARTFS